jgi:hypothetical protein
MPKKPGEVELKVIKEMFEASVDGQSYDTARWGQYFRPAGVNAPAGAATSAPATAAVDGHGDVQEVTATPTASSVFDDEPAVATAPVVAKPASSDKAQDILAMIRARQKA